MKKIHLLLAVLPLGLAACAQLPPAPTSTAACPTAAAVAQACAVCEKCTGQAPAEVVPPPAAPLQGADWRDLPGWRDDDLSAAWPGFLRSCAALRGRANGALWRPVCDAAAALERPSAATIRALFETELRPWALTQPDGSREGLITGYYEPVLQGARERSARYRYPVLGVPDDLLTIDFGDLYPELKTMRLRGRVEGKKVVPYHPRAEIRAQEEKAGEGGSKDRAGGLRSQVLAWVEDPVELFFLQIQGSGRVVLPDGSQLRVGYAEQNGHPYRSIGRVLIDRGDLKAEHASMQGIQAWARANPDKLDELLNTNPSYVFFRELPAVVADADQPGGPPGALGVPLSFERSLAVDPRSTPLGAPVFLATTQPNSTQPLNRLMLAQDTGGAIRGVVRADFFWGLGPAAGQKAGRMRQKGKMWVLLPIAYPVNGAAAAQ
jgi:membrane-bound lytic murein transglycosylase A